MKINHALLACLEVAVLAGQMNPEASPYRLARAIHDIHKIGTQLHNRYAAQCSYPYADTDRYRKRTETLQDQAHEIASNARLTIAHQGDPRGWPIIVALGEREYRIGGAS
jgi:hypothetical protein